MATNKRKDAAALFELLDKSTIKVPKNASNLKIPSWWSSKSNPASTAVEEASSESAPLAAPALAASTLTAEPSGETSAVATLEAPLSATSRMTDDEAPATEMRLFDPPPAEQIPVSTPSIRPPGVSMAAVRALEASRLNANKPLQANVPQNPPATIGTTPATSRPTLAQLAAASRAATAGTAGVAPTATPRPPAKTFAPQTRTQSRATWPAPKPGAFAQLPTWVLWAGAAAMVGIVAIVVMAARRGTASASDRPHVDASVTTPSQNVPVAPPANTGPVGTSLLPTDPRTTAAPARGQTTAADQPARVYQPGLVTRTEDQFYIAIKSTPSQTAAYGDAQFLAAHGIDVSVEIQVDEANPGKPLYRLISVKGYPTMAGANSFRDKIVKIGRLTDEYKSSNGKKGGWNDAAVKQFRSGAAMPATPTLPSR